MSFIQIQGLMPSSSAVFDAQSALTTPVAIVIADFPHLQPVLEGYGLDACCGGHMTVEEACREHGLDPPTVVQALCESAAARAT